ncbi:MAG: nuclear transport factor 2 family protein [Hydrococcus sp. SU_1_0]|nr:nuclear transport factor 2 family protein [Hydrococcus sp. SU_1_0]
MAQSSLSSAQIKELVLRQAQAWEDQNAKAIANDFAENAIFIAGGFKFVGQEQIRQAALDYFREFHQTSVEIKRIIIDGDREAFPEGNRGAVEWDWRDQNRKTGKEGRAEDAIVFELAKDKIIYWREYIEILKPQKN